MICVPSAMADVITNAAMLAPEMTSFVRVTPAIDCKRIRVHAPVSKKVKLGYNIVRSKA